VRLVGPDIPPIVLQNDVLHLANDKRLLLVNETPVPQILLQITERRFTPLPGTPTTCTGSPKLGGTKSNVGMIKTCF
jgi:hypothetical protein